MRRIVLTAAIFVFVVSSLTSAFALDTWNGGGGDSSFTTILNWGGATVTSGDGLAFGGGTRLSPNNDENGFNYAGIAFNNGASAFNLSGNAFNLTGNLVNNSASLQTISVGGSGITLSGTGRTVQTASTGNFEISSAINNNSFLLTANAATSTTVTLSGIISGTGGLTLVERGKVVLSGSSSNTYTGMTRLTMAGLAGGNYLGALYLNKTGGAVAIAGSVELDITDNAGQQNLRMSQDNQFGSGSVISWIKSGANGGNARFDLNGTTQTVAGLSDATGSGIVQNRGLINGETSKAGTLTINNSANYSFNGIMRDQDDGLHVYALSIVKNGSGSQTFAGSNIGYTGTTTVNGGTLYTNGPNSGTGAIGLSNVVVNNGGVIDCSFGDNSFVGFNASAKTITINDGGIVKGVAANSNHLHALIFGGGVLSVTGAGSHVDANWNFDAGVSTAGIGNTSSITGGTAALTQLDGTVFNIASGDVLNVTTALIHSTDGAVRDTGILKQGAGRLFLNAANTYSGGTQISAGTLRVGNANAVGTGNLVNNATGTLDLGTTALTVGGTYQQGANATLATTIASASLYGKITAVGTGAIQSGSVLNVTVTGVLPRTATVFTILQSSGAGGGGLNLPSISTSGIGFRTFTPSVSGGNFILTLSEAVYTPTTTTSNGQGAATALDNIASTATGDMSSVISTLDGLSTGQIDAAIKTMLPSVGFNPEVPAQLMDSFVGTQMTHLGNVMQLAQAGNVETGMSAGDQPSPYTVWTQAFGNYAHQSARGTSNGYNASNGGAAVGVEKELSDRFRVGLAVGDGESWVRSKDNNGRTNINATQVSLYGGYKAPENPFYLNYSASYADNEYNGSREIHLGPTDNRMAKADYHSDLYGGMVEAGYGIKMKKAVVTPSFAVGYNHLRVAKYGETGAADLNLNVASQDYERIRLAPGIKAETSKEVSFGTMTPEVHVKYLWDVISDRQQMLASFSGGGTAFSTEGYKAAKEGVDLGTSITLLTKKNVTVTLQYDAELRQSYYSHTGLLNVAYKF
ncbi:MAG: autotransporter domain-containing protein [Candidatus Omnitrophica bacterium]|nr:autotransporter domain-containing protein [Candidatus Omnitrophota bacterium]